MHGKEPVPPNDLDLNANQTQILLMALEFYIRLGLGQFSQISQRINLLYGNKIDPSKMERIKQLCEEMEEIVWEGKPWSLYDDDISLYTLDAFLLEAMMSGQTEVVRQFRKRIKELRNKGIS